MPSVELEVKVRRPIFRKENFTIASYALRFVENGMRIAASGHKGMPTHAQDAENAQKLST
jgi:hypothetical protein